jgi:isocitrate dehydrogenase kinase/phosphatase
MRLLPCSGILHKNYGLTRKSRLLFYK